MKGLYRYLSPFASDQAGAAAVFYDMGGITVIIDAGGCSGNISGFDERRFFTGRAAPVFSACLRDMDAILGRDKELVDKVSDALKYYSTASFVAFVGTPVPSVIGTDLRALCRMTRDKCGIPAIAVDTTGLDDYSKGEEKAYKAIIDEAMREASAYGNDEKVNSEKRSTIAVFGATPLEMLAGDSIELLKKRLAAEYEGCDVVVIGERKGWQALHNGVKMSVAVSPAGIKAAKYMQDKCGIPYKIASPIASAVQNNFTQSVNRALVIHQQCLAISVRSMLAPYCKQIDIGTFFDYDKDIAEEGDQYIAGEDEFIRFIANGHYDIIAGDPLLRRAVSKCCAKWIALPHWAVSGQLYSVESERECLASVIGAIGR